MSEPYSTLKFKDFAIEFGSFIKLYWNDKLIWDDEAEHADPVDDLKKIDEKYGNKLVYSMFVRVVQFHHTELYIHGEK